MTDNAIRQMIDRLTADARIPHEPAPPCSEGTAPPVRSAQQLMLDLAFAAAEGQNWS